MKKIISFFVFLLFAYVITNIFAYSVESIPLEDKSIIYFGDSIAEGSANNYISWSNYIQEEASFKKSVNVAKSGATFSTARKNNMIISQVLHHKKETYDYVLLEGGVNDAMDEVPLGVFNSSYQLESFDTDTYMGMLDLTFYYVVKYYNHSAIGLMITYPTPTAKKHGWRGKTSEPDAYYEALREVCKKWEIPIIDFSKGELKTVIGTSELKDGLHLNDAGYQKISPYLFTFIKWLQPYQKDLEREQEIIRTGLISFPNLKNQKSLGCLTYSG